METINLKARVAAIPELYKYEMIASMNEHTFTLVRVKERTLEFHSHHDSDEVFLIVEGMMQLEFRDTIISLKAGEMCVVPKGVEHRPICKNEVSLLLIEKGGTLTPENTGGSYGN